MRLRDRLLLRALDLGAGLLLLPPFAISLLLSAGCRLAWPRLRRDRLFVRSRRIGVDGQPFLLRRVSGK